MRGNLAAIFVLIILSAIPANSYAFYSLDEINEYLSYDRLKVITPLDDKNVYHPMAEGRLINNTSEKVYVYVHIYFCDVFKVRLNQITLGISMQPNAKVEFRQYLQKSEYELTRNAHHLEFEITDLRVGSKNIGRRYDICG